MTAQIKWSHVYWPSEQQKLLKTTKIITQNSIRVGGTSSWGDIRGRVRGGLLGSGFAIVRPVATSMFPAVMRTQTLLAVYSSTGELERWTYVCGHGFYTIVGKSWKYDREASHGKLRRPCTILHIQIRSRRILLHTREKSRSRWLAVSYTNFTASFWTLSSAWQSQERIGENT